MSGHFSDPVIQQLLNGPQGMHSQCGGTLGGVFGTRQDIRHFHCQPFKPIKLSPHHLLHIVPVYLYVGLPPHTPEKASYLKPLSFHFSSPGNFSLLLRPSPTIRAPTFPYFHPSLLKNKKQNQTVNFFL